MIVILAISFVTFALGTIKSHNYLCREYSKEFKSCQSRKLKILVIDWGHVDSNTGAANRHLGLLSALGSLGHEITRASLKVGETKKLPVPAQSVFESMEIMQSKKRLLKPLGSTQKGYTVEEYIRIIEKNAPDLVIMTLWFCGPSVNATVPGYLLPIHRKLKLRPLVAIESSDVHSHRQEQLKDYLSLSKRDRDKYGTVESMAIEMRSQERDYYRDADGVLAISDHDKQLMSSLLIEGYSHSITEGAYSDKVRSYAELGSV